MISQPWNRIPPQLPDQGGSGGDATPSGATTPGGSPPQGAGGSLPPAPPADATAPSSDPYAIVAGVKPSGLAEKFWNADAKQIRLPELMKSYAEAESLIGRRVEQMTDPDFQRLVETKVSGMTKELEAKALQNIRGQAPAEAKDYAIQLSDDAMRRLPEPMHNLAQYESDPLVGWFRNFAHEAGLGQGQFNHAFEGYLDTLTQVQAAASASERSKLGDQGERRMEQLARYLDANLEKRQAEALRGSLTSAEAFAAVESLVRKFSDPSMIRGFSDIGEMGRTGPGLSSEAEIRAAQKDPRYWDPNRRDNAYVRAIESAWNRLYPKDNGAG